MPGLMDDQSNYLGKATYNDNTSKKIYFFGNQFFFFACF